VPQESASAAGGGALRRLSGNIWRRVKEFSGLGTDSTYLWPRWLVLRAIGLVYILIFAGIVVEGRALIAPDGVLPVTEALAQVKELVPGKLAAFFWAPSFFWISGGSGMITALAWIGLGAAVALVLNLWPRMALLICWATFLSFVSTWGKFSPAQLDRLMLEAALLAIPFAPRGFRPRLGADSPPRPIALFMMRWLLFRVMLESGLVKLIGADPHWQDFTAMDVMYETAVSPTVLGYWVHHFPHAFHLFEIALTFAAELAAPLLALFGGRTGRWIAFLCWSALQIGIQLTCNFGWLNLAAFGLGFLLLDDQMIARFVGRLKKNGEAFSVEAAIPASTTSWHTQGLRVALGLHFCLTLFYLAEACGIPTEAALRSRASPIVFLGQFRSANGYFLYAGFDAAHYQVDFEGSNDRGKTWRTYEYRHIPQRIDRAPQFVAPWFPRFEATIQIEGSRPAEVPFLPLVATQLLRRNPEVMARFARDPFPDRPATVVRMRRYRMSFEDPGTHRRTGNYWRKEFDVDYAPAMYVTETGAIEQFSLLNADVALRSANYSTALTEYERQYRLGNLDAGLRLAYIYAQGLGAAAQPQKAFALFSELAERGEIKAIHQLGLCYEFGDGVRVDFAKAAECYGHAAEQGLLNSIYALGTLSAKDRLDPRNDVQGLALLLIAAARATDDSALAEFIRGDQPEQVRRLLGRMSAEEIAAARAWAARGHR
jgi:hypothetical protein